MNLCAAGLRMFGDVRQRFLTDMKQGCGVGTGQSHQVVIWGYQSGVCQGVGAKFINQPLQTLFQIAPDKLAWAQIEDISANIADGFVQPVNRLFDFLQGDEEYKYKLGGRDVKLYTLSARR